MALRVKKRKEYWWDIIYGGLVTFIIMASVGYYILAKLDLDYLDFYYYGLCLIIIAYCQWSDDKYRSIESNFSKSDNTEIVKNVLDGLQWQYRVYATGIQVTPYQNILNFLNVCIIPADDIIYFNLQYRSFVLLGRVPFFLGILTIVRRRLYTNLQKEIAHELQALQTTEFERLRN